MLLARLSFLMVRVGRSLQLALESARDRCYGDIGRIMVCSGDDVIKQVGAIFVKRFYAGSAPVRQELHNRIKSFINLK